MSIGKVGVVVALFVAACVGPQTQVASPGSGPAVADAGASVPIRGKVARKHGHGKKRAGHIVPDHVTEVVAVPVGKNTGMKPVRAKVARDGSFALNVPRGHRYEVVYEAKGHRVGGMRFKTSAAGKTTNILSLTQNVHVTNNEIDMGEVDLGDDGWAEASEDPYQEIDSDGDGIDDYADNDDDNDGIADDVDTDSDGDMVADAEEGEVESNEAEPDFADGDVDPDYNQADDAGDDGAAADDGDHDGGGGDSDSDGDGTN
jgi:hypothetical protein